jgi:hypothetical protein
MADEQRTLGGMRSPLWSVAVALIFFLPAGTSGLLSPLSRSSNRLVVSSSRPTKRTVRISGSIDCASTFDTKSTDVSHRGVSGALRMAARGEDNFTPGNSIVVEENKKRGERQRVWTPPDTAVDDGLLNSSSAATSPVLQEEEDQPAPADYEPTPPDASLLLTVVDDQQLQEEAPTRTTPDDTTVVPPIIALPDVIVVNAAVVNGDNVSEVSLFDPSSLAVTDDTQMVQDEVFMQLAIDLATQE